MTKEKTKKRGHQGEGGGRPPHVPTPETRKQVEAMVGYGIPELDIAPLIGISDMTLRKYYKDEIRSGTTKANAKVAQSLYNKAIGDNSNSVTAAIFWLKTRAGWKETAVIENNATITTVRRTIVDPAVNGTQPEFEGHLGKTPNGIAHK